MPENERIAQSEQYSQMRKMLKLIDKYGPIQPSELIKKGVKKSTAYKNLKILDDGFGVIKKIENGYVMKNWNRKKISINSRKEHTADLKKIIMRWTKEIPDVTSMVVGTDVLTYGIHDISEYMRKDELELPAEPFLQVEEEPFFKDLKNHPEFKKTLVLWSDFKAMCREANCTKRDFFLTY